MIGWREMGRKEKGTAAAVLLVLSLGGLLEYMAGGRNRSCTEQLFAMDTFMTFTAYGRNCEEAVEKAVEEVRRLDGLLSTGNASSEVSQLNVSGEGVLSEDMSVIFGHSMEIYEKTGGLFDVTIYPLMRLWGFPTQEYHVPTEQELAEVLPLVNSSLIKYDGSTMQLEDGQQMDLGGIAKGYASVRVAEIFCSYGVRSGIVSLGGNVQAIGCKPDGGMWKVGIQDPFGGQGEPLAVLEVEDRAVITSGGYERYFEENGNTYIHIIDPRTGYPADGDLSSVTVVSSDGMLADALSTALYIMGYDDAVDWWSIHREEFDMVLVTEESRICATEGISENLSLFSGGEENIVVIQ